jgi:hypothetical protein
LRGPRPPRSPEQRSPLTAGWRSNREVDRMRQLERTARRLRACDDSSFQASAGPSRCSAQQVLRTQDMDAYD